MGATQAIVDGVAGGGEDRLSDVFTLAAANHIL